MVKVNHGMRMVRQKSFSRALLYHVLYAPTYSIPFPFWYTSRTLFDLNVKDVSQCVMPGVKKSNDVELQLHESDATDQTEVGSNSAHFFFCRRGGLWLVPC